MKRTTRRKSGKPRAQKESRKQQHIVAALRAEILRGRYGPGERIPIQTELMQKFGMSSVTIQRALHELQAQEFLTAKRRTGTFVSERSPHLYFYPLVFPSDPVKSPVWSNFYESMRDAARILEAESGKTIEFFYEVEAFERSEDYRRLIKRVANRQLAGIIFASPPFKLKDTPLLQTEDVPKVAIASPHFDLPIPFVSGDGQQTLSLMAEHLAGRLKRKKIALFCTAQRVADEWLRTHAGLQDLGITSREQWNFVMGAEHARTATSCVRILMELPASQRPDGFLVMDDHLTEAVEQGLLLSGERVAKSVEVAAMCNFPDRFRHHLPISRFGCEVLDLLRNCMKIIDAQRAGKRVPKFTLIEPHFAENGV